MKQFIAKITKHPINALYGAFLLVLALKHSISSLFSGTWDAAAVDLALAGILLYGMFRNICELENQGPNRVERLSAWGMLICSNLLILLPESNLSGSLLRSVAFVILLAGIILHFSNWRIMIHCLPATLWCCVFIPFHEEIMLMASYPLRLSATMLAAFMLKIFGTGVVYSGTSLHLPGLDIAITDACSGINQLDAFLLIACIAVKMMHRRSFLQILHFAFIIPSIIIGNTFRIVLTILLFKMFGEVILGKGWHISLGYVQIVIAFVIFLSVGSLFRIKPAEPQEEKK